jgi:hypothetical protein
LPDVTQATAEAVSKPVRWGVYAFLGIFVVCALVGIEAWPFTAFKLFSQVRTHERVTWELVAVTADGDRHEIVPGELPIAYRTATIRLGDLDHMSDDEADELCRAWAEPLTDEGIAVVEVRIFEHTDDVRPDVDTEVVELAHACRVGR